MPVLKKQFLPSILSSHPEFKGVCLKECVAGPIIGTPPANSLAHTHVYPKDPFVGWICFKDVLCLVDDQVMIHEMAHLLTSYHHIHDSAWRAKLLELGGHMNAYDFRIGMLGYSVPCTSEICAKESGRDPEQRMGLIEKEMQDLTYGAILREYPTLLADRDRFADFLNHVPIDDSIGDTRTYLLGKLKEIRSYPGYISFLDQITVPIDLMYEKL